MVTEEFLEEAMKARGNELLRYARVKVAQGIQDNYLEDKVTEKKFNETVKNIMTLIEKVTDNAVVAELLK